jgi:hypothetical protein
MLKAGATPKIAATDLNIKFDYNRPNLRGIENVRDVIVQTPPGFVADPLATPRCTHAQLRDSERDPASNCPPGSIVGALEFPNGTPVEDTPVYNIVPRRGVAAEFGVKPVVPIYLTANVTADGRIEVTAKDVSQAVSAYRYFFRFFGIPKDEIQNLGPYQLSTFNVSDPNGLERRPFLKNPTSCTGPVDTGLATRSWQTPEAWESWTAMTPAGGYGCDLLPFEPTSNVTVDRSEASEPAGLTFDMQVPQNFDDPEALATAHVKKIEVALPEGVRINPALADGLAGCTSAQINIKSTAVETCPAGSKIGSVEASTPLLDEPIGGNVYLAQPFDNPFNSLIAVYVVAVNNERGIRLKIPGVVRLDPQTGQITATFDDNPQLPYDHLTVKLKGGDRAPLLLPQTCGSHEAQVTITPWSAADPDHPTEDEVVRQTSTINVTTGPGGRSCGTGFFPGFQAGTELAAAGESSPFVVDLWRQDSDQELSQIDQIKLPEGLLGRIAGIERCAADQADAGTCGEGSRIGRVEIAVGGGPAPAWIPQAGKAPTSVHLTGPYKGAPFGLSIVVPAQAGPFALGRVVVRAPLSVDMQTTALSTGVAESRVYGQDGRLEQVIPDGLPRIIDGIVLSQREVRVIVDRDGFMVNPTDCREQQISAQIHGFGGAVAPVASRFQVAKCHALAFAPRLNLRLKGATRRIGHPALRAVVTAAPGEANIATAQVNLPHGEFLDQGNLNKTCTRPVLMAGQCPESSIYGYAKAWTPLLDKPLEGAVYLVGGYGYKLPALVAELNGQIKVLLVGKVDSGKNKGIRNTFEVVPDAPVEKFELRMKGGKKYGLLENSENLCKAKKAKRRAIVRFTGQNGKVSAFKPVVQNECGKGKKKQKKHVAHGRVR